MNREEFMNLVYSELYSDGDNNRANRIIDAADEMIRSVKEKIITAIRSNEVECEQPVKNGMEYAAQIVCRVFDAE